MAAGITHELNGPIEAHGLAINKSRTQRRRVVPLEPGGNIHNERKPGRMTLRKPVLAEAFYLLETSLGKRPLIPALDHACN